MGAFRYLGKDCAAAQAAVKDLRGLWLFADGGVIQSNPSPLGGTLAYRLLQDGVILAQGSAIYPYWRAGESDPGCLPGAPVPVSNNVAEMAAILTGLEAAARQGHLVEVIASDSYNSLRRLERSDGLWTGACNSEMDALQERWGHHLRLRRQQWGEYAYPSLVLLSGHPSGPELLAGRGGRGYPVSIHNKWCDQACATLATYFLERREADPAFTLARSQQGGIL